MKPIRHLVIVVALLASAVSGTALGQAEIRNRYTLDDAIVLVKRSSDGQVIKATTENRDGRIVYRIRVLTNSSHVRTYFVDAQDGLQEE